MLFALLRATRRVGFRGFVGLALLIGIAGGAVLAGFGAARRTDSAFDRLVEDTEGWDVLVNPDFGVSSELQGEDVAALPMVRDFGRVEGVSLLPRHIESFEELDTGPTSLASDGHIGYDFARPLVSAGRMADPEAPDELFVSATAARELDLEVGDPYPVRLLTFEDFGAMEGVEDLDEALALFNDPSTGRLVDLEVVGIGTFFDEIVVDEGFGGGTMLVTPAFYAAYDEPSAGYWGGVVRLRSPEDLGSFRTAVEALVPEEPIAFQSRTAVQDQVDRAVRPQVAALVVFSVVAAGVGLVVVGQAISRRLQQDAVALRPLGALGVTSRQRAVLSITRVAQAALVGSLVAVVISVVVSPIGPVGVAREAEPDPGLQVDPTTLLLGAATVFLVGSLLAIWPAVASARRPRREARGGGVGSRAAELGLAPPTVSGIRFALDRGPAGVPAWSTLAGAVTSVALVAATVVFSSSLNHLVDHPDLYGTPWNGVIDLEGDEELGPSDYEPVLEALGARDDISAYGLVYPGQLTVDGQSVPALSIDPSPEPIVPTVLDGRPPEGPTEVALGTRTMDDLGVDVGDRVTLERGEESTEVTVVGTAVLPAVAAYSGADKTTLGEGVLASHAVLRRWGPEFIPYGIVVQVEGSGDAAAVADAIEVPPPLFVSGFPASTPSDIQSLERVRTTPLVLTGLLAALIALTVIHALAAAVRSRRGELAVLRTMGFTRPQVLGTVAVQALVIAGVGLLVGLPLGAVIGRLAWSVLATALGAVVALVTPALALGGLAVAVVALSLLAGLVPGLRAAAAHPASILRTE